jgi:RNA recognition motif-containing protein
MAKRIYVGGLPYSTTDQVLSDMFAAYGAVASANVITDRYTGDSKGFGFVEMESEGDANKAINALNGTTVGGRSLTVNEAKPREDRPRSFSGGGGGGGGRW